LHWNLLRDQWTHLAENDWKSSLLLGEVLVGSAGSWYLGTAITCTSPHSPLSVIILNSNYPQPRNFGHVRYEVMSLPSTVHMKKMWLKQFTFAVSWNSFQSVYKTQKNVNFTTHTRSSHGLQDKNYCSK
jgi:hypothetical protein